MYHFFRSMIAVTLLALLASCASTGENTGQDQVQPDTTIQSGIPLTEGQETYSYAYDQSPTSYETYDTGTGNVYPGLPADPAQSGQTTDYGQNTTGINDTGASMVSADRIVYFEFDSTNILPESRAVIEKQASYLASNPNIITQLEGHTDASGSREYNIALGERRANAVREYMLARGVPQQQIRVVSFGEERLTGGQAAMDRRVEILY
ncbi:MAG: peptidoglycan-associated lipoprotein [Candidatus Contendobacter odensis]|uniref:Peptidoglycan-associated lipoprotein n=1 Tax=Candidatus Contendibacter odensensis TaxID=1400860 RepID=A0A2G6PEY5_9GAMM|nr:MAG: peptidoglycan-associated lipoprotein [Candidatus Contendobacter odensis]